MTMVMIMAMITMMLMATTTPPPPHPYPQELLATASYTGAWVSFVGIMGVDGIIWGEKALGRGDGGVVVPLGTFKEEKENGGLNIESKSFSVNF